MNWFQILVLPFVALLFAVSAYRLASGRSRRRGLAATGVVIWLVAGLAILRPDLTTLVANRIGIGRGADLLLYVLVLAVVYLASYFYNRLARAEANLSRVVQHLAIDDALEARRRGSGAAATPDEVTARRTPS